MITVLGATGNTGRRVARTLLDAGEAVRAVGRDAARLRTAVPGAEHVVADATDAAALAAAFAGADAAYVLSPFEATAPGYLEQQRRLGEAVAAALRAARVPRVVALSSLGVDVEQDTGFLLSLRAQEQRLAALDADVLLLRPGMFFEAFLPAVPAMRERGVHEDSIDPDVALPMVATADVADAAAAELLGPARAGVREVLGPRDLTVAQAVAALGPALGVPGLRYVRLPQEQVRAGLTAAGLPADVVDLQLRMHAAFSAGTVRSRAGRGPATSSPTTIEEWARATFRPAPASATAWGSRPQVS
ncbi:NAD(P)H-binding protein [Kineococcus sp. SYSU DK006]|uniref:NAD(P)H-binding protein n=1 Tax=Kineococcus sp. SYSU DK006 TaxID=3383127 RepID=UPI003D7CF909